MTLVKSRNETGYRGVYKVKNSRLKSDRWYASFRGVYLGSYNTPEEAAKAYNKVVIATGYPALANQLPGEPARPETMNVKKILEQE